MLCVTFLIGVGPAYSQAPNVSLFVIRQDRVVDVSLSLEWLHCPLGQKWVSTSCRGTALALNLDEVPQAIRLLDPKNTENWRLPTREEIMSLSCQACQPQNPVPAMNTIAAGTYWTSEEKLWVPGYWWSVDWRSFSTFGRNQRYTRHKILLVRDRPTQPFDQDAGSKGLSPR